MRMEDMREDIKSRSEKIYSEIYNDIKHIKNKEVDQKMLIFKIDDSDEINGRAECTRRKDHIVINQGIIYQFLSYFKEVNNYYVTLILQRVMPGEEKNRIAQMSMEGIIYEGNNAKLFDSKDIVSERTKLLEIFVARFILLHEMGHIFNGHCEYLKQKKGLGYLAMHEETVLSPDDALNRRTIEMDADAFAATRSFKHLLYLYANFDSQVKCPFLKPMELFLWWAFAIRSHFLLFEDTYKDTNRFVEDMPYFPNSARWWMVFNVVMDCCNLLDTDHIDIELVKDMLKKGSCEAENVFNEIRNTNYHISVLLENKNKFEHYWDQANNNWDKLVNELEIYARCPLFKG